MKGGAREGAGRPSLSVTQKTFIAQMEELFPKAIEYLRECLESHNANLKNWATEIVLKKTVPDKKAIEVTGEGGGAINVRIIGDYLSKPVVNATPEGSVEGSDKVQGTDLAQESKENINSAGKGSAGSV
jgi:hypothetical protein